MHVKTPESKISGFLKRVRVQRNISMCERGEEIRILGNVIVKGELLAIFNVYAGVARTIAGSYAHNYDCHVNQ